MRSWGNGKRWSSGLALSAAGRSRPEISLSRDLGSPADAESCATCTKNARWRRWPQRPRRPQRKGRGVLAPRASPAPPHCASPARHAAETGAPEAGAGRVAGRGTGSCRGWCEGVEEVSTTATCPLGVECPLEALLF